MVLTLCNVLLVPITLFTSVEAMPMLCILPTTGVTVTPEPIFLVYTRTGLGYYECAIVKDDDMTQKKKVTTTRCTCGCMGNCKGTLAHLIDALATDNNLDVPEPAYAKVAVMTMVYDLLQQLPEDRSHTTPRNNH